MLLAGKGGEKGISLIYQDFYVLINPFVSLFHLIQNVWATTYAVGCGQTFCTEARDNDGRTFTNAWLVTCNYGPA